MSVLSIQPPAKPEIDPYRIPTIMIAMVAAKPIMIDTRPPSAVRISRSRPNSSVPNG